MENRRLRVLVPAVAGCLALAHLIWPQLGIDAITVVFLAAASIPWLAPWLASIFKSLEFPGGWKVEFQDFQKAADRAASAGLLGSTGKPTPMPGREYAFQAVAEQDANLALAGLRIEIERRLQALAEAKGIEVVRTGISGLLTELTRRQAITQQEQSAFLELIHLLNQAVHGAEVDRRAADWALEIGPRLLLTLEQRVSEAREPGEPEALRKLRIWSTSTTYGTPGELIPDNLFASSTDGEVGVSNVEQQLMLRRGWIEVLDDRIRITERGRRAAALW